MTIKKIILLILGIIFVIILAQNTQVLSMQILFWKISMSRIIFIPFIMIIGFIIGFLVGRKSWDW
ncbi:MAG: hypothetical protein A2306_04925 [Omnitrophica WOR_2 bacterium RIFOXYB2_FULL_38_16]|nr:MAG: hypothetical protein A2243_03910 [Omnitrophica WOR_2 bacterium RIFOXYA2_FULL_38_17]OGX50981.1 MAG: hypothetical protein A2267_03075 [Omnitrophica WOR_2 bacterium RIFOXYA12_FULL_38_10]OGX55130.1 MAG: hypothetical protein A2447_01660 [Omnitrophica WOR_2 bacterium RIFOXYC2_FULL_38_12]OGX58046.1 MAG: hypothetical protein A2306_04925 [Omnitrophica WOR_2 bacterium RIFOXYB2_FULL_38_16]HBG61774.1 DUF1049 domain-containing protein [Candidatus Omnitrophota bacterium]